MVALTRICYRIAIFRSGYIMRILYTILFICLLPCILFRLYWRSLRSPDYRKRIAERFAWFKQPGFNRSIWIHAVSMGEAIAVIPLVKLLQAHYPSLPIVITNTTPTGSARVKAALKDSVFHVYAPYDTPGSVKRFLEKVNPVMCILVETEIWPNYLHYCQQRNISVVLFNGRLSDRSARKYLQFKRLTEQTVICFSKVLAQTEVDANNFKRIGVPENKVMITGSVKFDIQVSDEIVAKSHALRQQLGLDRPIWIAASTHPTEEEKILRAHKIILETYPNALLILVPRHPDRFPEVAKLCKDQGFGTTIRTRNDVCDASTSVYLGDTMGEMLIFYGACDIAFVGGSFISLGGHNMLEPAALKKPVLSGPNVINFLVISDKLIKANAMEIVSDENALAVKVECLFQNVTLRETMGQNGFAVIEQNRGALTRQFEQISQLL